MYAWSLELRGFDVFTVSNGISALAEAGAEIPDIIVTDFTLPSVDGLELAERLKASPYTADVPILLLSGHALEAGGLERARGLCARVLQKPVLPDNLADAITAVLVDATSARLAAQLRRIERRFAAQHVTADNVIAIIDEEVATGAHPSAALLADDDGRYVGVNDAALLLTGRSREDLLARSVWDLTPGVLATHGRRMWRDFIASGSMQGTYTLDAPEGEHLTVWFSAAANVLPGLHLSLLAVLPPGSSYPAAA